MLPALRRVVGGPLACSSWGRALATVTPAASPKTVQVAADAIKGQTNAHLAKRQRVVQVRLESFEPDLLDAYVAFVQRTAWNLKIVPGY